MNALVRAAVARPVSTVMVFLALTILSVLAALSLGVSALPEIRVPKLVVSASYPGLPAQEVRSLLALPLEDALASVRGLKHLESISREGLVTVTLEFSWGSDLRSAGIEVRQALDGAQAALPADAKKPLVLPVDPADDPLAVVSVVPRAGDLTLAKRLAAKPIRTRLQQVRGVGSVVVVGGLDEEVVVSVDRRRLQGRSLTLSDLAQSLAAANYDYPAGTLTEAGDELVVKARGAVNDPEALGELLLTPPGPQGNPGTPFPVRDVAEVRLGAGELRSSYSVGGVSGVGLYVHRQPGAGPVETVDALKAEVARLADAYGQDLDVRLVFDGTGAIRESLRVLGFDALVGVLVAFAVVLFFVRQTQSALVIVVTVPVAIVLTLAFLKLTGRTLNVFSLGGLALSVGMMVDHTVVVLENLHRRVSAAGGTPTAALVGAATTELSLSNTGATGTAVIVFLPVIFLPGVVGSVFTDLSLAVMGAHVGSFVLSVTLVPALFLLFPARHQATPADPLDGLRRRYRRALVAAFRKPLVVVALLAVVTGGGLVGASFLGYEYFPQADEGVVVVDWGLAYGTSMDRCAASANDLETRLGALPGVVAVYSRIGGEADDAFFHADPTERNELIHTRVVLADGPRPRADQVAAAIRDSLAGVGLDVGLPTHPVVRLLGVEAGKTRYLVTGTTADEARSRAEALVRTPRLAPGITVFPAGSRPEWHFFPDRPLLAQTRTDLPAVAEALRDGVDGTVASQLTLEGRDVDIRIRMRAADRGSIEDLQRFPVRGAGALVAVGDLGRLERRDSAPAFYRVDRADAVALTVGTGATVPPGRFNAPFVRNPGLEVARDQAASFAVIFGLVLVLLYLFLGAQLESFLWPLAVMVAIPLAFPGVVAALVAGGATVNFSSLLGVVALFGIVINNSILLFQVYRDRARSGLPRGPGLVIGGSLGRLRPILMTSVITVLSLLPMALDPRGTSETPMALALVGGLAVSTLLTLFVTPLVFSARFGQGRKP